ncbi:unnamed protein product [Nezara viridula]|uniref:Uncharacterized protein n=1 Tax=Nezara viridula TaxID=85310 RepID=A0A9P0HF29_NEZVI|nr:unnamed protein product [Nezara viridula]
MRVTFDTSDKTATERPIPKAGEQRTAGSLFRTKVSKMFISKLLLYFCRLDIGHEEDPRSVIKPFDRSRTLRATASSLIIQLYYDNYVKQLSCGRGHRGLRIGDNFYPLALFIELATTPLRELRSGISISGENGLAKVRDWTKAEVIIAKTVVIARESHLAAHHRKAVQARSHDQRLIIVLISSWRRCAKRSDIRDLGKWSAEADS